MAAACEVEVQRKGGLLEGGMGEQNEREEGWVRGGKRRALSWVQRPWVRSSEALEERVLARILDRDRERRSLGLRRQWRGLWQPCQLWERAVSFYPVEEVLKGQILVRRSGNCCGEAFEVASRLQSCVPEEVVWSREACQRCRGCCCCWPKGVEEVV